MSPREAPQVDPAQRLALLTAAEALEQAGIVPDRTPSTQKNRVGVYFGATSNDWMVSLTHSTILPDLCADGVVGNQQCSEH